MNRKDDGGLFKGRKSLVRSFEEGRDQPGLPVVTVDDVGLKGQGLCKPQGGMGKKGEALEVVIIISAGISIEIGTVIEIFPV